MGFETVNVKIDKKTGKVKIETEGFVGEGCHCIDELEQSLGSRLHTEPTAEAYQYENPDILPNGIV